MITILSKTRYILHALFNEKILRRFFQSFHQCLLCKGKCQDIPLICHTCFNDLPKFSPHEHLLEHPKFARDICHTHIDTLICLAPYQWPFTSWIHQFKYQQQFQLAKLLSCLLIKHHHRSLTALLSEDNVAITNVPIHLTRWQSRGYNQSHLIAKRIATHYHCKYLPEIVTRTKVTEQQVGKTGKERRSNIHKAFTIQHCINFPIYEHIIIIDDVITTGTTANELAKICKKAGAIKVSVITLALALK